MSRLPRPHIPLSVRVQVAARQAGFVNLELFLRLHKGGFAKVLDRLLYGDDLGPCAGFKRDQPIHLDHDPPLGAREKIWKDGEIVGYVPAANDPEYLIYRLKVDHQVKTNIRGEHGQHPDRVLIKRQRRRDRKSRPRPKQNIRGRSSWPIGRKVQWWKKGARPGGDGP